MNNILLTEGVSPIVYHFTTIPLMQKIASSDSFIFSDLNDSLSSKKKYKIDSRMNTIGDKKYRYYLCLSRTPSSMMGYALMRWLGTSNDWSNALVRIELDGNTLNARFKGRAVDYFGGDDESEYSNIAGYKLAKKGEMRKIIPNNNVQKFFINPTPENIKLGINPKVLTRVRASEFEDRIFSDTQVHKHIDRYIKRIDILATENTLNNPYYINLIKYIINRFNYNMVVFNPKTKKYEYKNTNESRNIVFIYDNIPAFNSMNVRAAVNNKLENKPSKVFYLQKSSGNVEIPFTSPSDLTNKIQKLLPNLSIDSINRIISNPKNYKDVQNNGKDFSNFSYAYNGESFFEKNGKDINIVSSFPSDVGGLCGYILAIAYKEDYTPENFRDNVFFLCNKCGISNWETYNGSVDYSEGIYRKCVDILDRGDITSGSLSQAYGSFLKKNIGNGGVINLINRLNIFADYENSRIAKIRGKKPVKIWSTLDYKYSMSVNIDSMLNEMINDEEFVEEMRRYDFYLYEDSLMMFGPTPEEMGIPFCDNYTLTVKYPKIWKNGLLPIYEYYKENGEIDSNLLENLYETLWRKYRSLAKPYVTAN